MYYILVVHNHHRESRNRMTTDEQGRTGTDDDASPAYKICNRQ